MAKGAADVQPGDDCPEQIRKEKACQVCYVRKYTATAVLPAPHGVPATSMLCWVYFGAVVRHGVAFGYGTAV